MTVTEKSIERPTAALMARAMSRNNWPASSWMKTTGRNTATVVNVDAVTAPQTSLVPRTAATRAGSPNEQRRVMFSSTTTALSTSIPTANANPARLITFSERPSRPRIRNVPMMLAGIAAPTSSAPRASQNPIPTSSSRPGTANHDETYVEASAAATTSGTANSVRMSRCRKTINTIIVRAPPRKMF